MRRSQTFRACAVTLAILLGFFVPLSAVSPAGLLSSTTLNGAINSTQTSLVLASASASSGSSFGAPAAGQCLYVDNELMRITAVASTTMTVIRGTVHASTHATSAVILTGPCNQFKSVDPIATGSNANCTQWVLPWVNTSTGDTWWCDLVSGAVSVTNPVTRNGTAGSRRVAQ